MGAILLEGINDMNSEQSDSRSVSMSLKEGRETGGFGTLVWLLFKSGANCEIHEWAFRLTRSARVWGGPAVTLTSQREKTLVVSTSPIYSQGDGIEFVNTPLERYNTTYYNRLHSLTVIRRLCFSTFFSQKKKKKSTVAFLSTPQVYQRHNSHY